MWEEFKFQARLRYLAFKRTVGLIEAIILLILALVLWVLKIPDPWRGLLLLAQFARFCGEVLNHQYLAAGFQAQDRWTWFPFV